MSAITPEEVQKPLPQKPLPVEESQVEVPAEVQPEELEAIPEETDEPQPASRRKRKGT